MATFTVTANFTSTDGVMFRLLVLTGAVEAGGASAGVYGASVAPNGTVTPNFTNSFLAYVNCYDSAATLGTFPGTTTSLDNMTMASGDAAYAGYYNSTVTAGVGVNVGCTAPTGLNAPAVYEIPAVAGATPVQDASQPAAHATAASGTSLAITTAGTPPPWSVLVALISVDSAGTTVSLTSITDTSGLSLVWTPRKAVAGTSAGAFISTATIPGTSTSPVYAASQGIVAGGVGSWTNPGNATGAGDLAYATWTAP